jgi:hypothetical protein
MRAAYESVAAQSTAATGERLLDRPNLFTAPVHYSVRGASQVKISAALRQEPVMPASWMMRSVARSLKGTPPSGLKRSV